MKNEKLLFKKNFKKINLLFFLKKFIGRYIFTTHLFAMKIQIKINIQLACVMRLISVNPELGSHPDY